jgi:glycosyltransferase involved in cell wall biosynthesis
MINKRVLIVANLFHAAPRIPGIATFLPDFGWEPTVVTPPLCPKGPAMLGFPKNFLEKTRIVEAPYKGDIFWFWRILFAKSGFSMDESITEQIKERVGIQKQMSLVDYLMRWYQTFLAYPDTEITWKRPALMAAEKAQPGRFDAVLSSSPFPTSHIVASWLAKKYQLPWVADFRDPWTVNHNYPYSAVRKAIETALEVRTLKNVSQIVTASPAYAEKISRLHGRPVHVVTNGFLPRDIHDTGLEPAGGFVITYTGTIYSGKQDPEKFLTALDNLLQTGRIDRRDVHVRFYGRKLHWLKSVIETRHLDDVVHQCGMVPREETFSKQRESHLLLLLNWEDPHERGVYPLKFFEYLATGRPILATGGFSGDDIERLLRETGAGIYATMAEEIEKAILHAYGEYRQGHIDYRGRPEAIKQYSYPSLAGNLSSILRAAVEKR